MRCFVGPVESLGHPFYPHPVEIVVERQIGEHEAYCFSRHWCDDGPDLDFTDPPDVVVLWDPMWLLYPQWMKVMWYARLWDATVVGVYGDWFHGFRPAKKEGQEGDWMGTRETVEQVDAAVIDKVGEAALRFYGYDLPIVAFDEVFTYGRLIHRGEDTSHVLEQDLNREREWDVGYIGRKHARWVPMRPYYLDMLESVCKDEGWSLLQRGDVPPSELEETVANCKVTFNLTPGYNLNMRVYEALACGSVLLTEGWNLDAAKLLNGVTPFYHPSEISIHSMLRLLLDRQNGAGRRHAYAVKGVRWVVRRNPLATWTRILDCAQVAAEAACKRKLKER